MFHIKFPFFFTYIVSMYFEFYIEGIFSKLKLHTYYRPTFKGLIFFYKKPLKQKKGALFYNKK